MAPENRDYAGEIGTARAREIIMELEKKGKFEYDAEYGCFTSTLGGDRDYVDIKRATNAQIAQAAASGIAVAKNAGAHYYLHRIAFLAHNGRNIADGCVASHLCANSKCARGAHVLEETQQTNIERSRCLGPGLLDDNGHLVPLSAASAAGPCPHSPTCFPSRTFLLACPHLPPLPPVWSVPLSKPITITDWLAALDEENPSSPPASVALASERNLYSDAAEEEEEEEAGLPPPSSPPLPRLLTSDNLPVAPLPSSRPGSSPRRPPGRLPQLPMSSVPDSQGESDN